MSWYERAVDAAEKDDVHGRVDHESLGVSLHEVGYCYARTGRYEEALPWSERAVEAKRKGDIFAHGDEKSLQLSIDAVEHCRAKLARRA